MWRLGEELELAAIAPARARRRSGHGDAMDPRWFGLKAEFMGVGPKERIDQLPPGASAAHSGSEVGPIEGAVAAGAYRGFDLVGAEGEGLAQTLEKDGANLRG